MKEKILNRNIQKDSIWIEHIYGDPFVQEKELEIVIWIWWSESIPSAMLWAYIINAHELLEDLQDKGNSHNSIRIFIASHLSATLNKLDKNKTHQIGEVTKYFIEEFNQTFYPQNTHKINIEIDTQEKAVQTIHIAQKIIDRHKEDIELHLDKEVKNTLNIRHTKYGNSMTDTLIYSICHPIYEWMILSNTKQIIKIWWKSEKLYKEITKTALPIIDEQKINSISQKTIRAGKSPLYYPYKEELRINDKEIDTIQTIKKKFPMREPDYKLIEKTLGIEEYNKFLKTFNY